MERAGEARLPVLADLDSTIFSKQAQLRPAHRVAASAVRPVAARQAPSRLVPSAISSWRLPDPQRVPRGFELRMREFMLPDPAPVAFDVSQETEQPISMLQQLDKKVAQALKLFRLRYLATQHERTSTVQPWSKRLKSTISGRSGVAHRHDLAMDPVFQLRQWIHDHRQGNVDMSKEVLEERAKVIAGKQKRQRVPRGPVWEDVPPWWDEAEVTLGTLIESAKQPQHKYQTRVQPGTTVADLVAKAKQEEEGASNPEVSSNAERIANEVRSRWLAAGHARAKPTWHKASSMRRSSKGQHFKTSKTMMGKPQFRQRRMIKVPERSA
eukprot:gnl/TRDRNA2_/TRDRNA2_40713_c0_seq1.p1 gnl/TRDRNA2_/TRDRNA2_40713_c0~~gnl/TRDRNA2_/TRDRNA2_40713_c0_seq1.p1  ORF type:complete len:382 (-),score=39.84 gnl/TRDRNA2_/TRDRNA2_40713_c0_seq1:284-1258(-)